MLIEVHANRCRRPRGRSRNSEKRERSSQPLTAGAVRQTNSFDLVGSSFLQGFKQAIRQVVIPVGQALADIKNPCHSDRPFTQFHQFIKAGIPPRSRLNGFRTWSLTSCYRTIVPTPCYVAADVKSRQPDCLPTNLLALGCGSRRNMRKPWSALGEE